MASAAGDSNGSNTQRNEAAVWYGFKSSSSRTGIRDLERLPVRLPVILIHV
ncbi:MAG: hypothetical protein ABF868_00380 [Sporolactobacillus sp.]